MNARKRIALVAHDNKKCDLLDWVRFNRLLLIEHDLFATRPALMKFMTAL